MLRGLDWSDIVARGARRPAGRPRRAGTSTAIARAWFTATAAGCAGCGRSTTPGSGCAACRGCRRRASRFRYLTAALPVVADDDPEVFAALLGELRRRCAGGPWSHLLLGLHESDPLLPAVAAASRRPATRRTFIWRTWADGDAAAARHWTAGRTYLELGKPLNDGIRSDWSMRLHRPV